MKKASLILIVFNTIFLLYGQPEGLVAPGPLFTFGQNILRKGGTVLSTGFDYFETDDAYITTQDFEATIGLSNRVSLRVAFPVVLKERVLKTRSRGFGSVRLQGEGLIYRKKSHTFRHHATLVGAVFFPSSTTDIPSVTASKSFSYFIGLTNSILANNWFAFSAYGGLLPTRQPTIKLGSRFLYDFGLGKIIAKKNDFHIGTMLEMSGRYQKPNSEFLPGPEKLAIVLIFLGPSIRAATDHFVVQAGFQYPIVQKGIFQGGEVNYRIAISFSWRN